ncbi:type I site-specific deoxyribonuclease HsdR family [Mycoplasma sp. CAG:776]|nr:type I site-specific deoxyribonuclease HsdR family [Mycoplasma sp. CAG:776]
MQDEELIKLAQELTETVRKNRTVDWDKKEFARAYKRLLRIYEYLPIETESAVATVIKQVKLMSTNLQ